MISFLDMGFAFRMNSDRWQGFQRKKCKKNSIPGQKYRNSSILRARSIAANFIECRNLASAFRPRRIGIKLGRHLGIYLRTRSFDVPVRCLKVNYGAVEETSFDGGLSTPALFCAVTT